MRRVTSFMLCLVAVAGGACTTTGGTGPNPPQARVPPEQAAAKLRQAHDEATGFVARLSAAVREQPWNEAWASAREQELRQSFAQHPAVPRDALKSVECRQSRCELRLDVAPATQGPPQALAIDQWLAWSQPCGYTLAQEPGTEQGPGSVRVFLECEQPAR